MFYPETGGQPLEAIDTLFVDKSQRRRDSSLAIVDADVDEDEKGALDRFQWSIVRAADRQVKAYKRAGRRRVSTATLSDPVHREEGAKAYDDRQEVLQHQVRG